MARLASLCDSTESGDAADVTCTTVGRLGDGTSACGAGAGPVDVGLGRPAPLYRPRSRTVQALPVRRQDLTHSLHATLRPTLGMGRVSAQGPEDSRCGRQLPARELGGVRWPPRTWPRQPCPTLGIEAEPKSWSCKARSEPAARGPRSAGPISSDWYAPAGRTQAPSTGVAHSGLTIRRRHRCWPAVWLLGGASPRGPAGRSPAHLARLHRQRARGPVSWVDRPLVCVVLGRKKMAPVARRTPV